MSAEAAEKITAAPITADRVLPAEYERQEWVITTPEGVVPEDLKEPGFWAYTAERFRPYARLEIRADDGSWLAEAMVVACDRLWAKVHLLNVYELASPTVDLPGAQTEVRWRGPHAKWSVVRISDSEVLHDQCVNKDEAVLWHKNYEKTIT